MRVHSVPLLHVIIVSALLCLWEDLRRGPSNYDMVPTKLRERSHRESIAGASQEALAGATEDHKASNEAQGKRANL